jgi:hypothetical protein
MLAGPRGKGVHSICWVLGRRGTNVRAGPANFPSVASPKSSVLGDFLLSTLHCFVTPFSFTIHSCKRIMDSLSEEIWDVVIVGTSIPQSLLAL